MGTKPDVVVRAGTVIDGTGAESRVADIAIADGRITEVGRVEANGRREIDADGALVMPGWVDVHTHYDGQATWDPSLAPSSWQGVTTVVMGNCGVGFAPVRDDDHDRLIELMEGVEDIPGAALHEGLPWGWNDFEEYLDAVERVAHDIDLGAQVPHGAVRLFVMGERGAKGEPATDDDIARMADIAERGIRAGALGFTTSRTLNHRSSTGEPTPSLTATRDELVGIARGVGRTGTGVLQVVSDLIDVGEEFGHLRAMAEASGRPVSFSLVQDPRRPDSFREILRLIDEANDEGLEIRGQVATRAIGLLMGLTATLNPVMANPVYREIARQPLDERVATMRSPDFKRAVLEADANQKDRGVLGGGVVRLYKRTFVLGDPPDYEPDPATSIAAIAERSGRDPLDVVYDLLLDDDGRSLLYVPALNYTDDGLDAVREMLLHPRTIPGLSDGGAHVGTISDGSFPTTLLTHWCRDRDGEQLDIPFVVKAQSRDTAVALGLNDRGLLVPGYKADLNVIDFDGLQLRAPEIRHDLPAGGRRLLQRADGYLHTLVAGTSIFESGEPTGATPGQLLRGATDAPTTAG